jgi:ABC-type arginine/histidine transport system permease subunit
MFFVALTLAAVSLISGVALTLIYLLFDDLRRIYFDLRAPSFESLTVTTGLLAIGYFFLAYRGLASQPPPRRRRRIRRPQPPSTLALLED